MSKICALVVDDNADIAEAVCDRLESLGHKCVCVSSQDDARQAIAKQRFSYVLLDLEIPVKVGRGVPRIQNGENLLQEIKQSDLQKGVPIIVMSGHGIDSPSLAVQMMKKGACDYVVKPFPETGNTLEKAICDALAASSVPPPAAATDGAESKAVEKKTSVNPSAGDEMTFEKDSVSLWGTRIADELMANQERIILDVIRVEGPIGGVELAKIVGTDGGENAISAAVGRMRKKFKKRFIGQSSRCCLPEEIILSGGRGYRINDAIRVVDNTAGAQYAPTAATSRRVAGRQVIR